MNFDALAIGSTVIDVLAKSAAVVKTNKTIHHRREAFACIAFASKTTVDSISVQLGGSAANAATAMTRLGTKVKLLSGVGKDELGKFALEQLQKAKVPTKSVKVFKKVGTGIGISIISSSGEKSTLVYKGANNALSSKDLRDEDVKSCKTIFITSIPSKQNYLLFLKAMRLAKKFRKKTVFAPSITMLRAQHEKLTKLKETFDVVIMNQEEALYLTKQKTLVQALKKLPGKTNLVTAGKNGAFLFDGKNTFSIKAPKVRIADTSGAGDAFAGAFTSSFCKGLDGKKTLQTAASVAALKLSQVGAQFKGTEKQVEEFKKKHLKELKVYKMKN